MADARITIKIEGLDQLIETVGRLEQISLNVEKIADSLSRSTASDISSPRRLGDPRMV